MLTVGIHNNVVLEKAPLLNDKGTLEIYVKKASEGSVLDVFNSTSDNSSVGAESNTFLEFNQLNTVKFGKDATADEIITDITSFKDKLAHLVLHYKTQDKVKFDITRGTGITDANLKTKVLDQGILDIIYKNICEDFVANLKDVDFSKKFHLKTVRQSANKHYAKLPDSKFGFSGQNAFIQDAALPCSLKYSQYEIDKKKNDPTPVSNTTPLSAEDAEKQSNDIKSVFGG